MDKEKIQNYAASLTDGKTIKSYLETNERVVARVTDGIYRQPGSALRELIINAYDADATWVSVNTNAPKFDRITVEDNGNGMSPEVIVNLLQNIGGSAKRNSFGCEIGITSKEDSTKSPGGRKLIGKLGIGIFSVSQLTSSFKIISKTKGTTFRTVVHVNLNQFADENSGDGFKSGEWVAWTEPDEDPEVHGTTIILTSIRPQAREVLSDEQFWHALEDSSPEVEGLTVGASTPTYYTGKIGADDIYLSGQKSKLPSQRYPWEDEDDPTMRFRKLVDAVWENSSKLTSLKLSDFFDAYFGMVWNLALSLPLPYVEEDIFLESTEDEWAYFYQLSNEPKGSAVRLNSCGGKTVAQLAHVSDTDSNQEQFDVFFDGMKLQRPIRYRNLPVSNHAIKKPMVFVGEYSQQFDGISKEVSAGPLSFRAYFFWNPRIAPTEHRGNLVRIHGASGTLFDSTFFDYQVAELTRLRQITCEIFVEEGLEAALNIDRESFNRAHPHTVVLANWIHSALRQIATAQKALAKSIREAERERAKAESRSRLDSIVEKANEEQTEGDGVIPEVFFAETEKKLSSANESVTLTYELPSLGQGSAAKRKQDDANLRKMRSIVQLLAVYGMLDACSSDEQTRLFDAILQILESE